MNSHEDQNEPLGRCIETEFSGDASSYLRKERLELNSCSTRLLDSPKLAEDESRKWRLTRTRYSIRYPGLASFDEIDALGRRRSLVRHSYVYRRDRSTARRDGFNE